MKPTFSFVCPVFNEEETLTVFSEKLSEVITKTSGLSEIIFVDDGSTDNSISVIGDICKKDPRFKLVKLSRNFGHQVAITAGMDHAQGDAVIIMDTDLQDPPDVVPLMIKKWQEGYHIVYAIREKRKGETWFKKTTASIFYRLLSFLTEVNIPQNVGDFRLVDRKALNAFKGLEERNRFVRGLFAWIGFKQTGVTYVRDERFAGDTKYPFLKMFKLAKNAIFGFSYIPLRLVFYAGVLVASFAFAEGLYFTYLKVFLNDESLVKGWTSLFVLIAFLGGVQLIAIGVIGEYLAQISDEVKRRPLYLVERKDGFEEDHTRKSKLSETNNENIYNEGKC